MKNEVSHFEWKRMTNFSITLVFLLTSSLLMGNKYQKDDIVKPIYAKIFLTSFVIYCFGSTFIFAKQLKHIHVIKRRDGYDYDPSDIKFDDNS